MATTTTTDSFEVAQNATDLATICVLCSHNCGLRVDIRDGKIDKVRGDHSNPITEGYICNKGVTIPHYVDHDQRVLHPLRRTADGKFEQVSWDDALREIGQKLAHIRGEHGGNAIGLVGMGGQGNHLDVVYALSFLQAVGSRRLFNAYAQEKHQHHLIREWMFDAPPEVVFHPDVDSSDCLIVMGTNPKVSNRGHNATETFRKLAKDDGVQVIVVDPRVTETTKVADRHVRLKPGSDAYLLLALTKIILDRDWIAHEFLKEQSIGLDELRDAVSAVSVSEMATRCGLTVDQIEQVAEAFATAERASILYDLGVEQAPFSTLISYLIHLLCVLTDNAGRIGGNIFTSGPTPPTYHPLEKVEPARAVASGIESIAALVPMGMFSPSLVPEEIMVDHPDRMRAMIVEGSNPYLSYSDTQKWKEARKQLDLMVVIDPAMTETAWDADYVLPVPTGYEKWEWSLFARGFPRVFAQLRPPVVPRRGDTRQECEIYMRLLDEMGLTPEPPAELVQIAAAEASPQRNGGYLMTLIGAAGSNFGFSIPWTYRLIGSQLRDPALTSVWLVCHTNVMQRPADVIRALGPEWADTDPMVIAMELFKRILEHPEGVEIARFNQETNLADHTLFADKKVRLAPERILPEVRRAIDTPPPDVGEFPIILSAGCRTNWTANTIQRDPSWRKGRGPHCALHLSEPDATRHSISTGDRVKLRTRRGFVELDADVDRNLREGHAWIPNGFGMIPPGETADSPNRIGVNMNEITDVSDRDPISGCPIHKRTHCQIEKVG